jgi:hypothetical protein
LLIASISQPEQAEVRAAALAEREDTPADGADGLTTKTARAHKKAYSIGPPLVPAVVVSRIVQYVEKIRIRKKPEFVGLVCRYWSLKREARRGAPLLKRLHLEPWTANGGAGQSDEDKALKLEVRVAVLGPSGIETDGRIFQQLKQLREDLKKVRDIIDLVRQREAVKLEAARLTDDILVTTLYPHERDMYAAFEAIVKWAFSSPTLPLLCCADVIFIFRKDTKDVFRNPVSRVEVPDYFQIVKVPMSWSMIQAKLDRHEYWSVQALKVSKLTV